MINEEFPSHPHIQQLHDFGYAPPKEGSKCGQCGICWSGYEATISEQREQISKHDLELTQQEKHYLKELEELSKRNLDLFHENMMLKEKLK